MSLPPFQHTAWMEIQALGLLSEPSQGPNPPAWGSGCVDLCHAMRSHGLELDEVWDLLRSRCATAAEDVVAVFGHLHRFQVPRLKAGLVIKSKKCATSVVFHFPFSTSSLPAVHQR